MQDEPRNLELLHAVPIGRVDHVELDGQIVAQMNSAGCVLLARMPPTLAAARNTYSGLFGAKNASTAGWIAQIQLAGASRRIRLRIAVLPQSAADRRTHQPAMPAT